MLTESIMHDCLLQLFRSENLECFCMLLSIIGKELDNDRSRPRMNQFFELMAKIVNDKKKTAKVRFMLQDVIELRKASGYHGALTTTRHHNKGIITLLNYNTRIIIMTTTLVSM
ncbi:hypothetical protein DPMN_061101 [Dreissena polymorpha]|uniref:MIF4G domain-containing protein n=1 Tax=Dreissena polymorpha TaxID=45954 RepID=A0A9D4C6D5_DREPO|nr:hypothetical protein DPMN_061101 [Dreissena polymorpha]